MPLTLTAAPGRGLSKRAFFKGIARALPLIRASLTDPRRQVPDLPPHLLRDIGLDPRDRALHDYVLPSEAVRHGP